MNRVVRVAMGGLLVVASIAGLGVLTRYSHGASSDRGALRLAWRMPVPRLVECREPTEAELEALPIHMRQDEICEGRAVEYRLEVSVDGVVRHRSLKAGAGARGDRPIHVFQELPLEPGSRHVRVVFERADGAGGETGDGTDAWSPGQADADATELPARLVLDRRLEVGVRDVVLVTYDRDGGRLVFHQGPDGMGS